MPRINPPNCPFPILGLFLAPWLLQGCGGLTASSSGGSPNPAPTPSSIDVATYHYDNMRSGQNTHETVLTTANTNPVKFGKLGAFIVDGKVDAQPLYLSNVSIPGQGMRNVLYVAATEHGRAFDADSISGNTTNPLWMVSTQLPGELPSDDRGCGQVKPEIGITSWQYRATGSICMPILCVLPGLPKDVGQERSRVNAALTAELSCAPDSNCPRLDLD